MGKLTFYIYTPSGVHGPFVCDSVHLTVCDNTSGKGGGSYGIRAGHTKALLSLDKGNIEAFLGGEKVMAAKCGCGFATVENNTVTAVVEEYFEY